MKIIGQSASYNVSDLRFSTMYLESGNALPNRILHEIAVS